MLDQQNFGVTCQPEYHFEGLISRVSGSLVSPSTISKAVPAELQAHLPAEHQFQSRTSERWVLLGATSTQRLSQVKRGGGCDCAWPG
jgi:hypothetical protein